MFNWHNKKAKKDTIAGYLSRKYSKEELANLAPNSLLELPDSFESEAYQAELNLILADSPWKQVKYVTPSANSLRGIYSATKDYFIKKPKKETQSLEDYAEPNAFSLLAEDNSTENDNSSVKSVTNSETSSESLASEPNFSWKTPRIYSYEFLTDSEGIIFLWKAWTGTWQEPFIKDIYFDQARKYCNSWVKVQVADKLPLLKLPEGVNCFFAPVKSQEEMLAKNYWANCWIEANKELSNCQQCNNYFLPEDNQPLCSPCLTKTPKLTKWINPLWLVALALIIIIYWIN